MSFRATNVCAEGQGVCTSRSHKAHEAGSGSQDTMAKTHSSTPGEVAAGSAHMPEQQSSAFLPLAPPLVPTVSLECAGLLNCLQPCACPLCHQYPPGTQFLPQTPASMKVAGVSARSPPPGAAASVQASAHICLMGATTAADEHAVLKAKICTLAHLTIGLSHAGNNNNSSSTTAAALQQHPQQPQPPDDHQRASCHGQATTNRRHSAIRVK